MYLVNKNIEHDGQAYAKDSEIKESAPGFKELLKNGHVVEVKGRVIAAEDVPEGAHVVEFEVEEKKKGKK